MAQTYSEFKTYVTEYIWRQNDTDLANNLDKIIRMAESELNRKLRIQRRNVNTTIAPEAEDFSLPADFYQMRSVTNLQRNRTTHGQAEFASTSYAEIQRQRTTTQSRYIMPYYYTERGASANTLYLVGPFSAENPGSLALAYRVAVPDFQTDDTSWLEQDYLDLYLYAILKHVGVFLREDERIQQYNALMLDALGSAVDEDMHENRFGGSPLHMKSHRHVPQTRRN